MENTLDDIEAPADAGEHTDALKAVLARIPVEWGRAIQCGPGWYPIIAELDETLGQLDPDYTVQQVKEKFGGLRYYYTPSGPLGDEVGAKMAACVRTAEARAARTCEHTGEPGVLMARGSWYATLDPRTAGDGWEVVASRTGADTALRSAAGDPQKLTELVTSYTEEIVHLRAVLAATTRALHATRNTDDDTT